MTNPTSSDFLSLRALNELTDTDLGGYHYVKRLASEEKAKRTRGSFMIRMFIPHRLLCRFFGCLFVQNLSDSSLEKCAVNWTSPYTVYSLAWLSCAVYQQCIHTAQTVLRKDSNSEFMEYLLIVLKISTASKRFVNLFCIVSGSAQLVVFFRKASEHERYSGFQAPRLMDMLKKDWLIYSFRLAYVITKTATACAVVVFYSKANWDNIREGGGVVSALIFLISVFAFNFYDALLYLVMTTTMEVLLWYMRAECDSIAECVMEVSQMAVSAESSSVSIEMACRKVEAVRLNVCNINNLKSLMNNMWNAAICVSSTCLLWVSCMALYGGISGGTRVGSVVMLSLDAAHSSLSFADLATLSHSLREAGEQIRDYARSSPLRGLTDSYYRQLQLLYDAIDPKQLCISGGGFFSLDRSLIVSMSGALITYTVILTQTGNT